VGAGLHLQRDSSSKASFKDQDVVPWTVARAQAKRSEHGRLKSQSCHLGAVQPELDHLTSLSLSSLENRLNQVDLTSHCGNLPHKLHESGSHDNDEVSDDHVEK
jgi:hypothetical protein